MSALPRSIGAVPLSGCTCEQATPLAVTYGPESDDVADVRIDGPGAEKLQNAVADLLSLRDTTISLALQITWAVSMEREEYALRIVRELMDHARKLAHLDVVAS